MKIYIAVIMLVMLLAAASGCTTQQARPATTTPQVTTAAATEILTTVITSQQTTVPTEAATVIATPEVNATVTTVATTRPVMTASTAVTIIHIRNNTFVPDQLTVLPGTGITWVNDDSVIHVVKASGESAGKFTSSEMVNGAQFIYTFGETTGTYEFEDPKYPEMKGAIIVKKGETLWIATSTPSS